MSGKRQFLRAGATVHAVAPAAVAAGAAARSAPVAPAAPTAPAAAATAPPAAGAVAAVKARGTLVVLSFPHQENPFIRVQTEVDLKHYEGIDYEVMQGFARALGVGLEVHAVKPSFDALVPALLHGDGDVIASSFSITPQRSAMVAFSQPYFTVHTVVVVPAGSPLRTAADLAGKTASTVRGSSLEERIKALHPGKLHYVEFTRWNYDALEEKEADFTVLDETSTLRLLRFYPGLKVAFQLPGADSYGYAVKPGSDLRPALDGYLAGLRASGQLDEIVNRYLGAGDAAHEPPPPGRAGAAPHPGGPS
jgi:polar amino acid transport system substrate-binding protein